MKNTKEILGAVFLLTLLHSSYAPFPKGHPYQFLNPLIEPWWGKVSKDTQRQVLSAWKTVEPTAFALSRLVEAKMDLIAGRKRNGPPEPYPTESIGLEGSNAEPEGTVGEDGSYPEGESSPEAEASSLEAAAVAEEDASSEAESAPESESQPSSFAY